MAGKERSILRLPNFVKPLRVLCGKKDFSFPQAVEIFRKGIKNPEFFGKEKFGTQILASIREVRTEKLISRAMHPQPLNHYA